MVKANGFKLEAMRDKLTPKKRKPSKAKPMEDTGPATPFTPVLVLQQVGRSLEIPENEITGERLTAKPKEDKPKDVNDD